MATNITSSTSPTAVVVISFILVSGLFITNINYLSSAFDCKHGCFYVHSQVEVGVHPIIIPNRKILMGVAANINEGVEMRNVPSGPDPLHHNGIGGPKEPQD